MRIVEIFASIQGEGVSTGYPAIFVRLSGCNLQCPSCDTNWRRSKNLSVEHVAGIVRKLHRWKHPELVVITGGEPLLQEDEVRVLIQDLSSCFLKGFEIETNGTLVPQRMFQNTMLIVSPKLKFFSGKVPDLDVLTTIVQWHKSAVKIVARGNQDKKDILEVVNAVRRVSVLTPIYLMPFGLDLTCWREVLRLANVLGVGFSPRLQVFGVK